MPWWEDCGKSPWVPGRILEGAEAEGQPTGYRGSEVLPVPQMNKAGEGPPHPGAQVAPQTIQNIFA